MPAVKLSFGGLVAQSFSFVLANFGLFFHLVTIPWIASLAIRLLGSLMTRDSLIPVLIEKAADMVLSPEAQNWGTEQFRRIAKSDDFGKFTPEETKMRFINRWHLEKADPSLKLSPPKSPIIFYIEHTTPIRYRRWVKAGVEMWNKAFEKVGIVDAIHPKAGDPMVEIGPGLAAPELPPGLH